MANCRWETPCHSCSNHHQQSSSSSTFPSYIPPSPLAATHIYTSSWSIHYDNNRRDRERTYCSIVVAVEQKSIFSFCNIISISVTHLYDSRQVPPPPIAKCETYLFACLRVLCGTESWRGTQTATVVASNRQRNVSNGWVPTQTFSSWGPGHLVFHMNKLCRQSKHLWLIWMRMNEKERRR